MNDEEDILIPNEDLDYDQAYLRNKRLPRTDAQFKYTPEMIAEIQKCKDDIIYFAENYFFINDVDDGLVKIKLYPAQRRILKAFAKNRFVVVNASRQIGKCFFKDTIINIRNKKTGKIEQITAESLFNRIKDSKK